MVTEGFFIFVLPEESPDDNDDAGTGFDAALDDSFAPEEPDTDIDDEGFDFEDPLLESDVAADEDALDACLVAELLSLFDELEDLSLSLPDELDELVFAGERSALLPEPVSIAIVRLYVVTVTVPSATVAVSGPAHISSSLTTVSTPALEKTVPGTSS